MRFFSGNEFGALIYFFGSKFPVILGGGGLKKKPGGDVPSPLHEDGLTLLLAGGGSVFSKKPENGAKFGPTKNISEPNSFPEI